MLWKDEELYQKISNDLSYQARDRCWCENQYSRLLSTKAFFRIGRQNKKDTLVECCDAFMKSRLEPIAMIHTCQRSIRWELKTNCLNMGTWPITIFLFLEIFRISLELNP